MAKYSFDVVGSQLIVSLVPVEGDVQPTSMSYLTPSFKIGNGKINSYESGQPKQSFLFTEIGEIGGETATDLQDAFDKITTLTANFNGGGTAPYKVYTALLSQTGTDAPVATVLQNTLGGDIVWSYNDVGQYKATSAGLFLDNKTIGRIYNVGTDAIDVPTESVSFQADINTVYVVTKAGGSEKPTDELLYYANIEIRVYN